MSDTDHYRGTLTLVEKLPNETLEEQCKRLLDNEELPSYYDTYSEMLQNDRRKEYIVFNNDVFAVKRVFVDSDRDIYNISKGETSGTYDFEVKYYNGGCCFSEAIEEAFKNMKNNL